MQVSVDQCESNDADCAESHDQCPNRLVSSDTSTLHNDGDESMWMCDDEADERLWYTLAPNDFDSAHTKVPAHRGRTLRTTKRIPQSLLALAEKLVPPASFSLRKRHVVDTKVSGGGQRVYSAGSAQVGSSVGFKAPSGPAPPARSSTVEIPPAQVTPTIFNVSKDPMREVRSVSHEPRDILFLPPSRDRGGRKNSSGRVAERFAPNNVKISAHPTAETDTNSVGQNGIPPVRQVTSLNLRKRPAPVEHEHKTGWRRCPDETPAGAVPVEPLKPTSVQNSSGRGVSKRLPPDLLVPPISFSLRKRPVHGTINGLLKRDPRKYGPRMDEHPNACAQGSEASPSSLAAQRIAAPGEDAVETVGAKPETARPRMVKRHVGAKPVELLGQADSVRARGTGIAGMLGAQSPQSIAENPGEKRLAEGDPALHNPVMQNPGEEMIGFYTYEPASSVCKTPLRNVSCDMFSQKVTRARTLQSDESTASSEGTPEWRLASYEGSVCGTLETAGDVFACQAKSASDGQKSALLTTRVRRSSRRTRAVRLHRDFILH